MMKSSSLLPLGMTCCLIHLVQEGQGIKCYIGKGLVVKEEKREEVDCSTIKEKPAGCTEQLHCSCAKKGSDPAPERDSCVTETVIDPAPQGNKYHKYCGCSKGLLAEYFHPEKCNAPDYAGGHVKTCACKTDLCNNKYFPGDPAHPEPTGEAPP